MQLPPRVKSLYLNGEFEEDMPAPIEYAFFIEDWVPDSHVMNRYHFNFPVCLTTLNISVKPRRRKVELIYSLENIYINISKI